jgi:hypothetical protein
MAPKGLKRGMLPVNSVFPLRPIAYAVFVLLALVAASVQGDPYYSLVVVDDSLSDSGKVAAFGAGVKFIRCHLPELARLSGALPPTLSLAGPSERGGASVELVSN